MEQSRFSQRVTHFVDMHHQQRQASIDHQFQQQQQQLQQQQQIGSTTSQSKLFIRPMSPVSVDRQHDSYRQGSPIGIGSAFGGGADSYASSPPLSHQQTSYHTPSSPTTTYSTREIAIRDPYSSQPVTFSVIDPQIPPNTSDIPLRGQQYGGDAHSDYSVNFDRHYVDDTRNHHLN
jgi:hypothetical protein